MMPNSIVTNVICLFCASINKFYLILSLSYVRAFVGEEQLLICRHSLKDTVLSVSAYKQTNSGFEFEE